jgi:hypothetical protein
MLQNIQSFLQANNATTQLENNYSTMEFNADAQVAQTYGLTLGLRYTLWVSKKDHLSKSGNQIAKGQWFITPAK